MTKYPKIKVKSKRKTLSKQLDDLWRQYIYQRANNRCEFCGKDGRLQAHHIFSRSNRPIRWDEDNGICLCPLHHTLGNESFHKSPATMIDWLKIKRGQQWYDRLLLKAGTGTKFSTDSLAMLVLYYKKKLKEYDNGFHKDDITPIKEMPQAYIDGINHQAKKLSDLIDNEIINIYKNKLKENI